MRSATLFMFACAIMLLVLSQVQEMEARKTKVCEKTSIWSDRINRCHGDKNQNDVCVKAFADDGVKVFQCRCSPNEELICYCHTAC
ncbi:unnamed protein product [Arabidopsis lyrata]|nr:unnamed protein product [Arabidopsis lyrata]